ncbi:MAG: ABC transporter ATP-binding protein [Candidatus Thermoplasmatota archaeon]|jgi:glucose/arabinose transport system ATP-binding protein|nr:ABC transporter ATP-binding protein [Candidatus Thermoplasmatota archaeon]
MVAIKIENLSKKFVKKNNVTNALQNINLEIGNKQFFGILGSSGSGKTTLMRIIAGLEVPTKGIIRFDDKIVSKDGKTIVEVEDRNVGMVFQNWALYPHLTNFENIAFPLRVKRLSPSAIKNKVTELADMLNIREVLYKKPRESSGGQQQRVAYARALSKDPSLLLLDEPFSNLDATIKDVARNYTRELQEKLGFTAIIVSHDPADIFSLSKSVGVIHKSLMLQVGKPIDVYKKPLTVEVARATGELNVLKAAISEEGNGYVARAGKNLSIPLDLGIDSSNFSRGEGTIGFRPDEIKVVRLEEDPSSIGKGFFECGEGIVVISSYSQGSFRVNLKLEDSEGEFFSLNNTPIPAGEKVRIFIRKGSAILFPLNGHEIPAK